MGRLNEKYKNKILVGVYGTLKKDFPLHDHMVDCNFLGTGETFNRYLMTDIDRIPISNFQKTNKKYQEFKKSDLENTPFPYLFFN